MMHTVPRDARDFGSLICKAWCARGRPSTEWPFDPDIVEVWNESFWNVLNLTIRNSSASGFKDSPNASMLPWQLSNPDTTWPQSLKRTWHHGINQVENSKYFKQRKPTKTVTESPAFWSTSLCSFLSTLSGVFGSTQSSASKDARCPFKSYRSAPPGWNLSSVFLLQ